AQGDGGMPPVGESDDELRSRPTPQADDLDLLAAERMMGMGNGDEPRRRLGRRGSALWVSPPWRIEPRKHFTCSVWTPLRNLTPTATPMAFGGNVAVRMRWLKPILC